MHGEKTTHAMVSKGRIIACKFARLHLNGDLASYFQQWYPELKLDTAANKRPMPAQCKLAA